jgi:hypothetical protein
MEKLAGSIAERSAQWVATCNLGTDKTVSASDLERMSDDFRAILTQKLEALPPSPERQVLTDLADLALLLVHATARAHSLPCQYP